MFNLLAALLGGEASDGLSHDIARQNGRDKPNYKDRFQAAMNTIWPLSIMFGTVMSAYISPEVKSLFNYFIDRPILTFCVIIPLAMIGGVVGAISLYRFPFWLTTMLFIISISYSIIIFVLAMQT